MLDTIVVTLAAGAKYIEMAAALLRELDAVGNATLVVTDDPRPFPARTIIIPYTPDGCHIWHAKRHALRAGLERARTVYYIDADYRRSGARSVPRLTPLPGGLAHPDYCSPLGELRFNYDAGLLVDAQAVRPGVLDQLQAELGTPPWREILWCGDDFYAVSRDDAGAWQKFLAALDHFAKFQPVDVPDRRALFAFGDGIALAFATASVGWRPAETALPFGYLRRAFTHDCVGNYR